MTSHVAPSGLAIGPDTTPKSQFRSPDWVKDAVFYQIFPDRFAQSERVPKAAHLEPWEATPSLQGYKGGDLLGVVERLDHLSRLGVNAIYFCPVFQSGSNHRYHTHDYFNVDPMLGGNAALHELIAAAHARGIRVVLDGVFNHASRGFFQFHDVLENGERSAYLDWFHIENHPVDAYGVGTANYAAWWGIKALPKFNTNTPAVREFLWNVAEHWIQFGADGWRLDVPNEIDDDGFWREFRRRVKTAKQDAYIVGEIWGEANRWLQGDQFDAVMNYPFTRLALGFFGGKTLNAEVIMKSGYQHIEAVDAPQFAAGLEHLLHQYPWEATLAQLNLLGSHDTPRVLTAVGDDLSAVKLALLFQFAFPGAPCVYYGDEVGLEGRHDPDCRRGMPWEEWNWNADVYEWTRKVIEMRHRLPALRRGTYRTVAAKGMTFAFERRLEDGGQPVIVVLNADAHNHRVVLEGVEDGVYVEYFTGERIEVHGGQRTLGHVGARSGMVLEKRG